MRCPRYVLRVSFAHTHEGGPVGRPERKVLSSHKSANPAGAELSAECMLCIAGCTATVAVSWWWRLSADKKEILWLHMDAPQDPKHNAAEVSPPDLAVSEVAVAEATPASASPARRVGARLRIPTPKSAALSMVRSSVSFAANALSLIIGSPSGRASRPPPQYLRRG